MMRFEKASPIPCSARELFEWHAMPGAFQRLSPPWQPVELIREDPGLDVGKRIELKLGTPIGTRTWLAEHVECTYGEGFVDTQLKGPFVSWTHRHRFRHIDEQNCELIDEIDFELPAGRAGAALAGDYTLEKLERSFAYRHAITRSDVGLGRQLPDFRSLRILISGGSGFLGTNLSAFLRAQGHEVKVLTRSPRLPGDVRWDPANGEVELPRLEGFDAVFHLAGANLSSARWTEARKRELWSSRVDATRFLVDALDRLEKPPSVFLGGSGIGYYGSAAEAVFDESSRRGEGFLAELCEAWEAAAWRAESLGCRVVNLRTGVVLDPRGGALAKMLPAFKLGGGGPLGSGAQWFPWIALEDWIRIATWCLFDRRIVGPVNLVAPGIVRQRDFAQILGKVLRRPAFLPAPRFALKMLLGEMADEALFASTNAVPAALGETDCDFALGELEVALRFCLGR